MTASRGVALARRLGPGLVLSALTLPTALWGWPGFTIGLVGALVALTPVAPELATRVVVGLVGLLVLGSLCAMLPLPGPAPALVVTISALLAAHLVAALRCSDVGLMPRVGAADLIVIVGVLVYGTMLTLPYLGGSADDVLLDLARGYDNVNHVAMVSNLIREGAAPWPTADGSQAIHQGYPLAVHQVIAAVAGADSPSAEAIVTRFAGVVVVGATMVPAVAGWIGVRVSASIRTGRHRASPEVATALAFVAILLLGGDYLTTFVLGHTSFYLPAVIAAGSSWLAFGILGGDRNPRGAAQAAGGLLAACALGLLGAYPPLIAGLAPAGFVVLMRLLSGVTRRARIALVVGLGLLAVAALVIMFAGSIRFMLISTGENGRLLLMSALALSVTVILWRLAALRGPVPYVGRALAPVLGFVACAVALLGGAAITGGTVIDNYYATKLFEAAWLLSLPVTVALVESLGRPVGSSQPRLGGALRAGVLVAGCAFLLILPVGRVDSFVPGPNQLQRRLLEANRARGQVMLVADALAAGSEGSVATVVPEPNGWFLPVDQDLGQPRAWTKPALVAAQWVMALRGVRTVDADPVAECMTDYGDATAIPCVQDWVDAGPARRLAVVIEPGVASAPQWRAFAARRPTQVRIVEMAGQG